ncbi:hypothetical protein ACEU2D_09810 [Brevibacillus laterosporus]|uniref:hypothetical protein n=1 Tax=Brevibacillus laterosporus TaxID=1465 RepID=UPI0035A5A3A8
MDILLGMSVLLLVSISCITYIGRLAESGDAGFVWPYLDLEAWAMVDTWGYLRG